MSNQFNRSGRGIWIALFALALFSFPFTLAALQHEPAPPVTPSTVEQPNAKVDGEAPEINREKPSEPPCGGATQADLAKGTPDTSVIYKLSQLEKDAENWYGKTITVDGEMHRQFTDRVFTIEDDGFLRDRDVLVISLVPMSDSVIPLQDSFERGKNVRVTGTVRPYDEAQLECLFGPLNVESREGHSFTKNPVLILGYKEPPKAAEVIVNQTAELEPPPALQPPEQPVQIQPPAPAPAPIMPEAKPEPKSLPKTASTLPFVGLAGLLSVFAAFSVSAFRSVARSK
jgi:hypothetical protein